MYPVHLKLAGPLQTQKNYSAQRQKYLRVLWLGGPKLRAITLPPPLQPREAARRRRRFVFWKTCRKNRSNQPPALGCSQATSRPGPDFLGWQTECRKGLDEDDGGHTVSLRPRPWRCAKVSPEPPGPNHLWGQSLLQPGEINLAVKKIRGIRRGQEKDKLRRRGCWTGGMTLAPGSKPILT